jgi:hypothetical protein
MAILASVNWYVRVGGNVLNGGGWDSTISGAGINYADADAAILSPTDLATSGAVDTVTSVTGGFTANMVGNCLRIASGTNFTPGYYFIITFTDTNTIVLDRVCATAAGSGGTGRIGGAFATPWGNLPSGGAVTAPTITSPLAAGHTIYLRGSGSDAPVSADYASPAYGIYPAGNDTVGQIRLIGYNGRPKISGYGLIFYTTAWHIENLEVIANGNSFTTQGLINGAIFVKNVRFDQAGYDIVGCSAGSYYGCSFINSGSTSAGTSQAIIGAPIIIGCMFYNWRGPVLNTGTWANALRMEESIIANSHSTTAALMLTIAGSSQRAIIRNCTFYGNVGDAVKIMGNTTYDAFTAESIVFFNNIFANNGAYGIRYTGTLATNDKIREFVDHNAFYGNVSGPMYLLSAGTNDITLSTDPFVDAATGDFRLNATAGGGAALKNVAFPIAFPST